MSPTTAPEHRASSQPPRWKRAFPDFDGLPKGIPAGFNDASWRNDAMPSFVNEEMGLCIWVDYADRSRRDDPDAPRFALTRLDGEGDPVDDVVRTDEWDVLVQAVAQAVAEEASPSPMP